MYKIDNLNMLKIFSKNDEIRYFYDCVDITLSVTKDYKVKSVEYFVENENDPLSSYVSIKNYCDNSTTVIINSQSKSFAEKISEYLSIHAEENIYIASHTSEILNLPCFKNNFTFYSSERCSPIYAVYSEAELSPLAIPSEISIFIASDEEKEQLKKYPESLSELEENIREDIFYTCVNYKDTCHYLIKTNGKIIGFLRAECGYKNYYDIGWLYISPKFRNKGYGSLLTLYFSYDCFENGKFPHYGYAVSDESSKTALKCGYINTRDFTEWKILSKNKDS